MKALVIAFVEFASVPVAAQTSTSDAKRTPRFEDYPVTDIFTGKPGRADPLDA